MDVRSHVWSVRNPQTPGLGRESHRHIPREAGLVWVGRTCDPAEQDWPRHAQHGSVLGCPFIVIAPYLIRSESKALKSYSISMNFEI